MRSISCAILGFAFYYVAAHTNKQYRGSMGFFVLMSYLSLLASVVLLIFGQ